MTEEKRQDAQWTLAEMTGERVGELSRTEHRLTLTFCAFIHNEERKFKMYAHHLCNERWETGHPLAIAEDLRFLADRLEETFQSESTRHISG